MSRRRVTAADARLVWQRYEAADPAAALGLTITRGYSLSTFYNIIRAQTTVREAYFQPAYETKWTGQQKGLAA
jgi:hypothetical protein